MLKLKNVGSIRFKSCYRNATYFEIVIDQATSTLGGIELLPGERWEWSNLDIRRLSKNHPARKLYAFYRKTMHQAFKHHIAKMGISFGEGVRVLKK